MLPIAVFIIRQYVAFWTVSFEHTISTLENTVLATWQHLPDPQIQVGLF